MSWVTNVLLLFSLDELFSDDSIETDEFEMSDEPILPIRNINSWLKENGQSPLFNLDEHIKGGKSMEARVYGGAFNCLHIREFIQTVKMQVWKSPQTVQLLIQDAEDDRFAMINLLDS